MADRGYPMQTNVVASFFGFYDLTFVLAVSFNGTAP